MLMLTITDAHMCIQVPEYLQGVHANLYASDYPCMHRRPNTAYAHIQREHINVKTSTHEYGCLLIICQWISVCWEKRQRTALSLLGLCSWEWTRNTRPSDFPHATLFLSENIFFIHFSGGLLIPGAKGIRTCQAHAPVPLFCWDFLNAFWGTVFWLGFCFLIMGMEKRRRRERL